MKLPKRFGRMQAIMDLADSVRENDFYCYSCDRMRPHEQQHLLSIKPTCQGCVERKGMSLVTRAAPVAPNPADLEYDTQLVWELFSHNKNSTLDYGWIRNKILRSNGRLSNDRQNAALDNLERKEMIEKVSHGRWRYKKPNRPSAAVVASAPATPEESASVIPQFSGATTDLVYQLLRSHLPKGLTMREIFVGLGITGDGELRDRKNVSASLQSLERMGWIDVDRSTPEQRGTQKYTALTVNKLGRKAEDTLRHARADVPPVAPVADVTSPIAAPPPASSNGQARPGVLLSSLTLEQVKRYAELKTERARLQTEIDNFYAERLPKIQSIDSELKTVYGEG